MQLVLAVSLALVSAAAYAWGALLQHRLAGSDHRAASWAALPAVGANVLGAGLHVAALHAGPLLLVQPLGALSLVFALPWSARQEGRRVTASQWRSAVLVLVGLDTVVVLGSADRVTLVTDAQAVVLVMGTVVVLAAAWVAARRMRSRAVVAGVLLGCSSGVASAVGSTLTQTWTHEVSAGRTPWAAPMLALLLAVLVLAATGLLLAQVAYRAGLAAPMAALTASNVLAAALVGGLLLGTAVSGWSAVALTGAIAVAGLGIVGLTRVPSGRRGRGGPSDEDNSTQLVGR